jgi:hypothetical protein
MWMKNICGYGGGYIDSECGGNAVRSVVIKKDHMNSVHRTPFTSY